MAKIGLINPTSKRRNYQGLAKLSATMPPHWMAVRAAHLRNQGHTVTVCDCEVQCAFPENYTDMDRVEIMPSGVHPHAFIHEQAGIDAIEDKLLTLEDNGRIVSTVLQLDFDPGPVSPDWDGFDLTNYDCHNWHGWGVPKRYPYGTLASSVSCPYNCDFCNIKNYYNTKFGFRDLALVKAELTTLYNQGVRNIKMMDELFVVNGERLLEFCGMLQDTGYDDLNIWGYARLDCLMKMDWQESWSIPKHYGINWLCLGIESGNRTIRAANGKGDYSNDKVITLVKTLHDHGIAVLGNFMFGFPDDTASTMQETLDLATTLNCEYSNFYCVVPYPGTETELYAKRQGWEFPPNPSAYSQYAYDFQPLPTHTLTAGEVLTFRDNAWQQYHTSATYLSMMKEKFGGGVEADITAMTKIPLERELLK